MLNVMLCIESRIYGQGLSMLLRSSGRLDQVYTAVCLDAMACGLNAFPTDVIVIDAALCIDRPLQPNAVKSALDLAQGQPVVALGLRDKEDDVLASLEAGAAGCVTQDQSIDDLIDAIEAAALGELLCPPRIARRLQERLAALSSIKAQVAGLSRLTQQEHFILGLLEKRMSNKQIARQLGLEVSTIKNHVHNILVKLSVTNRTEAVGLMQAAGPGRGA